MKKEKKPLKAVLIPHGSDYAKFGYTHAAAVQALASGSANEEQQKIAFKWIVEDACALRGWPYKHDQRETDIGLGRHFVGHQIMSLVNVNLTQLRQYEEK